MPNPKYEGLTAVGVGAVSQDQTRPEPTLNGVGEFKYVTLLNPLPIRFTGKVGQTRTINSPMRIGKTQTGASYSENDLVKAGLDLRNSDVQGRAQLTNEITIEPGKTINLRGDEAQVIVRQLVNEVMHYRGQTLHIGSPAYRKKVEDEIIKGVYGIDELLGTPLKSEEEQINQAIAQTNVPEQEVPFPTLSKTPAVTISEPKAKKPTDA